LDESCVLLLSMFSVPLQDINKLNKILNILVQ